MISPVLLSEVVLPEDHPRAGSACMVFGFVVHHSEGPVLVDTGVGVGHRAIESLFSPVHHSVDGALGRIGVERYDVRMVINSHLHSTTAATTGCSRAYLMSFRKPSMTRFTKRAIRSRSGSTSRTTNGSWLTATWSVASAVFGLIPRRSLVQVPPRY